MTTKSRTRVDQKSQIDNYILPFQYATPPRDNNKGRVLFTAVLETLITTELINIPSNAVIFTLFEIFYLLDLN
jgi:hypothetical protein